ncbi:SPFH domain-containing protein [Streptacidiphilus sp. ASG 303]|uniref:SPFH domain-containing protein n=1 Tax=Streptacidiphilus sp. ASG 303 TaxID=2896847 RepID=UPI001E42659E|nr:SPFH domain-containing protein [Streptacidiphilus sp. ASG 303]MCD0483611.1 SPFH domain-containing protein [Streptacidiphilus sp. ASG 303]
MTRRKLAYGAAGVAVLIVVINVLSALFGGFDRTDGGEVAVVRNGGMFDDRNIRQIIPPASGLTWTGLYSTSHKYPSQQRFYTITARAGAGDRPGVDVVRTPSSDGVDMGIEGTLYFTLNLDQKTLRDFDNKFGTRGFTGADGRLYHAYDGDLGWSAFLDQIIRPVIDNDLREQISRFRCAELVSSCALVQNSGSPGVPPAGAGKTNNGNIAAVQNAVNSSLAEDLKVTLGDEFLQGLRFNLVRVSLPDNVQAAVDKAQAAFAAVSEAQARVAQAKADAAANSARQQGYQKCPACAVIDEMKAIPPSVTTFAPGQNFAVTAPGK